MNAKIALMHHHKHKIENVILRKIKLTNKKSAQRYRNSKKNINRNKNINVIVMKKDSVFHNNIKRKRKKYYSNL